MADAEVASGPMLPMNEYAFLPAFPTRVDGLNAGLGKEVTAPLITLSAGEPVVVATLTAAQRAVCKPGAAAEIAGDGMLTGVGSVTEVGASPPAPADGPAQGTPAGREYFAAVAPSPALDPTAIGQSVLLKIEVAVSDGEQLVVPVSALYADGGGRVSVNKLVSGGRTERIEVEPGLNADGYVVVIPKTGSLADGDQVTIGVAAP